MGIGSIVGAIGGVSGMVIRTRKLQRAKYGTTDMLSSTPYQPKDLQVCVETPTAFGQQVGIQAQGLSVVTLFVSVILQAQDSAYKSTWRSVPSVSNLGGGTAVSSSRAAALFASQHVSKNPLDQRLLQEDAIRRSGVSGPLGMGVVMQSEWCMVHCSQTV